MHGLFCWRRMGSQHAGDRQGGWRAATDRQPLAGSLCASTGWRGFKTIRGPARSPNTRRRRAAHSGLLEKPPPAGLAAGRGRCGQALGDVDVQYVWRFLRAQHIDLDASKSWCESDDAEFAAKAADIVGLYLAPPENAVVLCVDEKPSIQALERAQGYLKLPNGRALSGHSHDYTRHGTTTLFAALDLATGKVAAAHTKRRRRVEFLAFMDSSSPLPAAGAACRPRQPQHPQEERGWLSRPRTCTSTSPRPAPPGSIRSKSGSQSSPARRFAAPPSLPSPSFRSTSMPSSTLQRNAAPFVWTKKEVHQRRFKDRRISQL